MNADVSRRVFVGSVAAGLPLVAGAFRGIHASPVADQVHDHAATDNVDPVFDHVIAEMAVIHQRMQVRGPRGEDARAIAAQLRTAFVRSAQVGLDAPTKRALGDLIRSRGREAVLNLELDRARVKARLKQYGIQADDRWFDSNAVDYNTRTLALDNLARGGVSQVLERAAATFEAIGGELDKVGAVTARVRRVQSDPAWYIGYCAQLASEINRLTIDAAMVCGVGSFLPALDPVCGMISIAIGIQMGMYRAYCG
jgi:hypothetical protein